MSNSPGISRRATVGATTTRMTPRLAAGCGRIGIGLAILAIAGCGGGLPATATVRGTVEFDGKPLSGFDNAGVLFTPRGGRMAKGVVQSDGSFKLSSFGDGDGAIVGPAHVTVSATVDDPQATKVDRGVGVRWIIPERFAGEDSGLSCEVLPGQENVFRIQLHSNGKGTITPESE